MEAYKWSFCAFAEALSAPDFPPSPVSWPKVLPSASTFESKLDKKIKVFR
jgi:hypothetical protein